MHATHQSGVASPVLSFVFHDENKMRVLKREIREAVEAINNRIKEQSK